MNDHLENNKKQTKYGELYFNISSLYFSCEAKDYYLKIQKTRDTKKRRHFSREFYDFSPSPKTAVQGDKFALF